MNAADLLLRGAPTAEAIASREETLSYAGLRNRVARSAFLWQRYGLRPGKRCVIGLVDGTDWVAAFLGAIWMGAFPLRSVRAPRRR